MAGLYTLLQDGLLVDRTWLYERGIKSTAVDYYVRSGELEAIAHGVYRKPGPRLKWENVLYSLNQLGYICHVGHSSALRYHGLEHYLQLTEQEEIMLYCNTPLPSWINNIDARIIFTILKHNPIKKSATGIEHVPFGMWDWPIPISSPERAFVELTSTLNTKEEIEHAKLMIHGALNLRPKLLQSVLESCGSVKAKRLFMWMARSTDALWYKRIETSCIDFGTGKRQIFPNGVLDKEYLITVPKEAFGGETESIF